jgi:hypothetical protein
MKIKAKQLNTQDHSYGEVVIADGNGGALLEFPQIQKGDIFPSNPTSGDTFFYLNDNYIYQFDGIRNKWLTINKYIIELGRNMLETNTAGYLGIADLIHNSITGFNLIKNGTILSASIMNENVVSRNIQIRINNSSSTYVNLSLTNQNSRIISSNFDFNNGDFLNVFIDHGNAADMNRISVLIEIAWRH